MQVESGDGGDGGGGLVGCDRHGVDSVVAEAVLIGGL